MPNTVPMRDPEVAFSTPQPPVLSPKPSAPDLDPPGADRIGLNEDEAAHFRQYGYIIKRGLIPATEFSPFLDLWWQQPPVKAARMSRDDPQSWVSPGRYWSSENRWGVSDNWLGDEPWPGPEDPRPGASVGERVGRLPFKLTPRGVANDVWRWHGIGHDPEFVNVTSAHPNVLHMAEALMGGPVKRPRRNRGIYAIFPRLASDPPSRLGPHMDENMTEMVAVTYLEDVEPSSGGFTIYPQSPQLLYPTSEQALNWMGTPASDTAMDDIKTQIQPLEFTGKAGDVLFCHGWMVHSAGVHNGERIRMAAIQDFNRVRRRSHMRWTAAGKNGGVRVNCDMSGIFAFPSDSDDDPADGLREVTNQWIMDSNEFVEDMSPPAEDMFADWNLGRVPVTGQVVNEPAWWEKYDLPMLPEGRIPRGGGGTPAVRLSDIATYIGEGRWQVDSRANNWMET
jgi:hypothetical protein